MQWPFVRRSKLIEVEDSLGRCKLRTENLHSKYVALHVRCLMAEGYAIIDDESIKWIREHFPLYTGPPGYEYQPKDSNNV